MRNLILLLFLLVFNFLHSQDIKDIKKLDTIYIFFKEGNNQHKTFVKDYDDNGYYFFDGDVYFCKDAKGIYYYDNSDIPFTKVWKSADERYVRKCFLRKHKKEIIGIDFFKKLKDERISFVDFSEKPKIYYIIDAADFKKNKIKLVEVNRPLTVLE
jgi:hypothetical protein